MATNPTKPLKGSIQDWGYTPMTGRIYGTHQGKSIQTSRVEIIRVEDGVIVAETRNSRYHLGNCL
jgi:hypothetical protein